MSLWRERRNDQALRRLGAALPPIFPATVLLHALSRPLIPPAPRLAVESYWRAHPLRADRLARALARRTGAPAGWAWRLSGERHGGLPRDFRTPPAPYREGEHAGGPGRCCVCGQPVFRFGWHADLWAKGANGRAAWHACCVAAWKLWTAPGAQARHLRQRQGRRCPETGTRLLKTAEVDHRIPLFRVWRDHRDAPWPDLLGFWGAPNLQVINRPAHVRKCAAEAGERSRRERDPAVAGDFAA